MSVTKTKVSIGQVKRDISELLNRVAYGNEHIVLTSRGKPKAVIVSVSDYEQFTKFDTETRIEKWESSLNDIKKLNEKILAERQGKYPIEDFDKFWQEFKAEQEQQHDWLFDD